MSEPVVIRCRDNGPLVIHGSVSVVDAQGKEFVPPPGKETVALCRCGHSNNKPFCDGTHKTCGFQASESAQPE